MRGAEDDIEGFASSAHDLQKRIETLFNSLV